MNIAAKLLVKALLEDVYQPPLSWRVVIQKPDGPIPGYVQIDMIDERGDNAGSTVPEKVRKMGYWLPNFDDFPQGSYSMAELLQ